MNSPLPCLILELVEVAAPTRELAAGTMLDDKYRIERLPAAARGPSQSAGALESVAYPSDRAWHFVRVFDGSIDDVRAFTTALSCE